MDTNITTDSARTLWRSAPSDAVKEQPVTRCERRAHLLRISFLQHGLDLSAAAVHLRQILGNLPLVGPMFRFERGANRTFHQPALLVTPC